MSESSSSIHQALGLTDDEFDKINEILGREPNHLELAMYSVMWSEHCSYKSSRVHLSRFPTTGDRVLVGPGEGAGVIDVGHGIGAAIRIESHNHPSAIEPFQGAATGVGGILRDIFSMGARPIAVMDPLRFGPLDDARSRWIAEGVVSGISHYGNAVGVPTVGGETVFDATYQGNPLVNVFCLGVLPHDRLTLGRATGAGNLAVLLGSSTGRDGIGGVSVLASAGFDDTDDQAKRPSVQVGDPFEEKRLIEACLELLDRNLAVGVQDLGGAGLTCATAETAAKGEGGMDVYVDRVHQREPNMEPFEVMISESQERMLVIVEPSHLDAVLELAQRWEVGAAVVGEVTGTGRLRILAAKGGEVLADVPAKSLEDDAPKYRRPLAEPADWSERQSDSATGLSAPDDCAADLLAMLGDPAWVHHQYDSQLFLNTVVGPGGDAAVLRLKDPVTNADTGDALALTADGNHRWCAVDPSMGAQRVLCEAVMNLATVGAIPLAMVNCLNFGNPEHPEVMWQLSQAVDGFSEACRAFGIPVVGGNVSLYNESRGADIDPTPIIATLGLIEDLTAVPPGPQLVEGGRLLLLGDGAATLDGSLWAFNRGHRRGSLPNVDFAGVSKVAEVVRSLVVGELVHGVHDVSEGGLGVALAEMVAASEVGATVARVADHGALFGEGVGRAVVCVDPEKLTTVLAVCEAAEIPVARIGLASGDRLVVKGLVDVSVGEVVDAATNRLPDAIGSGTTQG